MLRGFAILGVVTVHTCQASDLILSKRHIYSDFESSLRYLFDFGLYGVSLFFVISGYLLAKIYGSRVSKNAVRYFRHRAARILPLWLLVGIIYFVVRAIPTGNFVPNGFAKSMELFNETLNWQFSPWVIVISYLTFSTWLLSPTLWNSLAPGGWSIQSEVAHYIFYPIIRRSRGRVIALTASVCGLVATWISWTAPMVENLYLQYFFKTLETLGIFTTFPLFLFGILIFKHENKEFRFSILRSHRIWLVLITPGFILLLFSKLPVGYFGFAVLFVVLLWAISFKLVRYQRVAMLLSSLGKYSYFIYFSHFLVIDLLVGGAKSLLREFDFSLNFSGSFLVVELLFISITLLLSFCGATVSWKFFESPVLRIFR